MPLKNTTTRYGAVSKGLHWSMFVLIVYQYLGANVMTRLGRDASVLGMDQDTLYNWHKSIGLVVVTLALARLVWRRTTPLPEWSDALTPVERAITHRLETMLYALMFLLPASGYLFVTAGGYGIRLFGLHDLPDPVGRHETLAVLARAAHVALAYGAVVVVSWHVGLVLKKHVFERHRFLQRMLPGRD